MSFSLDNFGAYYDELYNTTTNVTTTFTVDTDTLVCESLKSPTMARLLCFTYIAIFHMAVPGNVLVGWVICENWRALTPSDIYLFHLTIADFLLALTLPFWASKAWFQSWIFGDFMCKFVSLIREANFYTSILFLVCISIDRYLAIVCAARSRRDRQRFCSRLTCGSIWVLGVALALPALFNEAFTEGDLTTLVKSPSVNASYGPVICAERYDLGNAMLWRQATRGLRHVLGFLLPLIIMVTCYSITVARLLRTRGFRKHRAMRVIMAVVAAFLLCWMPYHLALITDTIMRVGVDLVEFSCAARRSADVAQLVTQSLALFHCCINPVLYAIVGEKFRGNLGTLKSRRDVVSRPSFSRSTSGNGMVL
ncbi:C-X-C chemokine receptor type 2 [Merluccius polli]|uniref:C-X-C chemokine receptor type 2 n=1 Tax=Merluccius polli TaxID=89951 RepID=A0AA47NSE0_MERPO|nr:C-X-C chemokine receptor type 2 [Merluccius polli]